MPDMTLSQFGRAACPVCGRDTALTKAGTVRQHGSADKKAWPPTACAGVGKAPKTEEN